MFHFDRLWALRTAADHFLTGPLALDPAPESGEMLVADLRLQRNFVGQDPLLSLALYIPGHEYWPAIPSPVIRKVTWDKVSDSSAIRRGAPALSLTTTCEYFEVPHEALATLDHLISGLDRAIAQGGWLAGTLPRDAYQARPPFTPAASDVPILWEQIRIERPLDGCYVTLEFEGEVMPAGLATACSDLWSTLLELTTGSPLSQGTAREHYTVTPDDFQRSLQSFFAEANQAE